MPTYTYKCTDCEHNFETVQRISDSPLQECPSCKKMMLQRVISPGINFRLKGSDWFKRTTVLD